MSRAEHRVGAADIEGPATLAASTLLSIVLLHPDVHTPRDAITRAHRQLDAVIQDILGQLDERTRAELADDA